jgi:leucyl/phenylalanyl-tRNA--protein transferase
VTPAILTENLEFPDPRRASVSPQFPGLVAVGGDLSAERLLLAYRSGIFPWSARPITWWSPDPRGIFELNSFHVARSLKRVLLRSILLKTNANVEKSEVVSPGFAVTVNRAFRDVMEGCAFTRTDGNWISPEFIDAYTRLHEAGHAHSIECWQNGILAGGIYGVAMGGLFAGESMFHRANNASKVALYFLIERLRERGFVLFDIQMLTPTTQQLGAVSISREEYLRRLAHAVTLPVRFL